MTGSGGCARAPPPANVQRASSAKNISLNAIARFDCIRVEELNIMVRNPKLSKAILDVAWSQFFLLTKAKAENAGRLFEKVPAAYTSQTCSECNHRQKMPLKIRVFDCENCNHIQCRDENAAVNILNTLERREIKARGDAIAHLRSGNVVASSHLRR